MKNDGNAYFCLSDDSQQGKKPAVKETVNSGDAILWWQPALIGGSNILQGRRSIWVSQVCACGGVHKVRAVKQSKCGNGCPLEHKP